MALSSFFSKLKTGLSKSAEKLGQNLAATFTRRKLDEAALEELEDMLIAADLGTAVAGRVIENFRRTRFGKEVTDTEVREALATEIAAILNPVALPLIPEPGRKPFVILMVGVNGAGKTTTIGKLAIRLSRARPDPDARRRRYVPRRRRRAVANLGQPRPRRGGFCAAQ